MLEVHRCRQIEWSPSAVVALATSVNGGAVAAARENGAIEIWIVAAGSLGWHCQLTIPGRQGAAISSLTWCLSVDDEDPSPLGRLFSSGLDGLVTEWNLHTLQPKAVVESMGGSVWQLAAEHMEVPVRKALNGSSSTRIHGSEEKDSKDEESSSSSESDEDEPERGAQRVALACEDGVVRIFEVAGAKDGLVYQKSFPRVKGRILSVAWTWDGRRVVAGGSDGCIRCWDITHTREMYRITAGIGTRGKTRDLCVWSLLVLRNGDIVSGDSTGSTQFWDGQLGILLQAQSRHKADVLALAATHDTVFSAGADGQVIQFQKVYESQRIDRDAIDIARGSSPDKWIFVGAKRMHSHDVRALAIATPIVAPLNSTGNFGVKTYREKKPKRKRTKENPHSAPVDHRKWARFQAPMLISGGNDAKLFTYSAKGFLSYHPHDVCPCPERPFIQLAKKSVFNGERTLLLAQHSTKVDIWKIQSTDLPSGNPSAIANGHSILGKRKWEGGNSDDDSTVSVPMSNGHSSGNTGSKALATHSNGHVRTPWKVPSLNTRANSPSTPPPALTKMATIKINSNEHIVCSAISGDGRLVAFADSQRPRLYELEPKMTGTGETIHIKRRKLPAVEYAAHCMVFSADSSLLIVAGPHGLIWVLDLERARLVHTFEPLPRAEERYVPSHNDLGWANGIVKVMCTSSDGQWLAAASSSGFIAVFNLEVLRHHWTVPVLDGNPATAMIFHPESNNVLFVSSAANQIHALDVEVKAPGEWSRRNGAHIAREMQEFPGTVIGLSLSSTSSTSLIAYSSSAMCRIDFNQPIGDDVAEVQEDLVVKAIGNGKAHDDSHGNGNGNGNGKVHGNGAIVKVSSGSYSGARESKSLVGSSSRGGESKSLVVVKLKNPVLFLGHTGPNSLLIVEKPWLEVLRQFPAPVLRRQYGT